MRTTAIGMPSMTRRVAVPGTRASRAIVSLAMSGHLRQRPVEVELGRHLSPQLLGERADRQLIEHLVEEAEHDQPLGDLRRDAPALEVEALVGVDRADRRGVTAAHVVGLDLEVRDALGPRSLAQREVAVGLECCCAAGVLADLDEAGVDAARLVLDGTFEEQVARRVWSVVVLDRPEVVHLLATGEVEGDLAGAAAGTDEAGL